MTTFNVTDIQFLKHETEVQTSADGDFEIEVTYSANVVINDEFIVQVSGDKNECRYSMPHGDTAFWGKKEKQNEMFEADVLNEVITQIEAAGFENNLFYLEDHGEVM